MKKIRINTQAEYDALLSRFYNFYDGVIQSMQVRYRVDGDCDFEIYVECRDSECKENKEWVVVRLLLLAVPEFTLHEGHRTTNQVLSAGIYIGQFDIGVAIEFAGEVEREVGEGAQVSLEIIRSSEAYAIGKEIEFEVGPYKEEV